jgi:hypothetical protein
MFPFRQHAVDNEQTQFDNGMQPERRYRAGDVSGSLDITLLTFSARLTTDVGPAGLRRTEVELTEVRTYLC